jgi:peroxiredoxin (alkyl hydroperoxide reductase subunit C)
MEAWGKSQNVTAKVLMMADPFWSFTKAIGADVDKSARGLGVRSNRYTMLINNLKVIKLQEEEDAGACEVSAAQNFLNLV